MRTGHNVTISWKNKVFKDRDKGSTVYDKLT